MNKRYSYGTNVLDSALAIVPSWGEWLVAIQNYEKHLGSIWEGIRDAFGRLGRKWEAIEKAAIQPRKGQQQRQYNCPII